ncbi:MAG: energy transducer TonB [Gemmatimonas sp.]|jgi:protein TonB|uniref:energy transducer TonB n=1 Tax=Gemmatimonas sp. TaxID=1962908 RepID=UPI0025BF1140|nr:energy transducer TonB [Gemmatimonas sp.]MCA2989327.1 energy transducer TonB [Gemmatimonas sp.]MCE2953424.1 energy transducer TonB [Gemmatimonas sp.]
MPTPADQRLTLRAFESTRRASWRALGQPSVGIGAEALILACFALAGWLEQRARAADQSRVDESVRFLAPFRRATPPPSQERLSFVGLDGAARSNTGQHAVPSDHGRQPVALAPAGSQRLEENQPVQPESDSPRAMTEIEVDSTAALDPTAEGPVYPPPLMQAGVQGVVYAQFVVDSTGYADTLTMQVLDKADPLFVQAVRNALPRMRYKAAVFAGRRVNQLVQQAFVFRIQPPGAARPDTASIASSRLEALPGRYSAGSPPRDLRRPPVSLPTGAHAWTVPRSNSWSTLKPS